MPFIAPTSTLEKLAIHGFTTPSVVVAHARFVDPVDVERLRRVFAEIARSFPALASRVRMRFGTPTAFVSDGETIPVRSARTLDPRALLRVPDPRCEPPFEVHVAHREVALRAHHAVLDGAGAMDLVRLAARLHDGETPLLRRAAVPTERGWRWLQQAKLRRTFPADAFGCELEVHGAFRDLSTEFERFSLPQGYAALRARARARGVTFSEWMCARLLLAFESLGRSQHESPRPRGLLVAAARPTGPGRFSATQRPVELTPAQLGSAAAAEAAARQALRSGHGHDELGLALFYAARRLIPPRRQGPFCARSVHFTYSDLSRWDLHRLGPKHNRIEHAQVLVSPSHPAHAGLTLTRVGDALHLALLAHAGVVPLATLRNHLTAALELP